MPLLQDSDLPENTLIELSPGLLAYRIGGWVFTVHQHDVDPHPSNPHAHCDNADDNNARGGKLDLRAAGDRWIYKKRQPIARCPRNIFDGLCDALNRENKFPRKRFPL